MITINLKHLKAINFLSISTSIIAWSIFFFHFVSYGWNKDRDFFLPLMPNLITLPLFVIFSIIISLKTSQNRGVLLYALFMSLASQNYALQYLDRLNNEWIPGLLITISSAITGTVFIKSLQSFPRQLTLLDINSVFPKNLILCRYLQWSLKKYTWLLFPAIILSIGIFADESKLSGGLLNIAIIVTAVLGLFVNFKKSSKEEQNKILWLFWGLLAYTFIRMIGLIVNSFNLENTEAINLTFSLLKSIALLLSMVMSLFFYNTFDTGVIIKRTIVDGSLFILIVLFYNTLEHYFLHWVSHELHLSDVLVSSFLSGLLVMLVSPLHHKLMHFMEKKIKEHDSKQKE